MPPHETPPQKRFGQNFPIDHQDIIRALVAAIHPQPTDLMVEIGPGLGALTQPLLKKLDHLHVVELDRNSAGQSSANPECWRRIVTTSTSSAP